MADICKNQIKITGQIKLIEDIYEKTGEQFWISKFCPAPENAGREWFLGHWGVKWDADNSILTEHSEHYLTYEFQTPWSPPTYAIEYISTLYKDVLFELSFTDGYSFYGKVSYINGICVSDKHSKGFPDDLTELFETDKLLQESEFLRNCLR